MRTMIRTRWPCTPSRGGLTLLEILVVLAVIAVIAVMATPNLVGPSKAPLPRTARMEIATIEAAAKMWALRHDEFPASLADLTVATPPDTPQLALIPEDPWGHAYRYEYPSTRSDDDIPAIWSIGPNGVNDNGNSDDIRNWGEQ